MQCFNINKQGTIEDLTFKSGEKIEGEIYVLYKPTNEPQNAPAILKKGKITVMAQ